MSEEKKDEPYKSPHERRLEKHEEKSEEALKQQGKKPKTKKKGSKFLTYLIIALIGATAFQFLFPVKNPDQQVNGSVVSPSPTTGWESLSRPIIGDNWTADYSVYLCGEKQSTFPQSEDIGVSTYGDGKIHIYPNKPEQTGQSANLGRFFQSVGKKFSETELLDKKNGDLCSNTNQTGKVKLLVNGQENTQFRNYVPRDGDKIDFRFE